MPIRKTEIPGFFCSDPHVQKFFEAEAWNFNPHDAEASRTPRQILDAAILRYGLWACYDVEVMLH